MDNHRPTTDYDNDFDPTWYLDTYYCSIEKQPDKGEYIKFVLEKLRNIYQSGVINKDRLLDIGTGPSILSLLEASDHVTEIFLSDYAEVNRKLLNDWWKCGNNLQKELFEYTLNMLHSKKTVQEKQDEMRKKVRGIFPIDVTKDLPLSECFTKSFDVIMSSLCLEVARQSLDAYKACAKNMTSLLKPGGHLVLLGVLNESFYRVGDYKFMCVKISATQLKQVYQELGYHIISFENKVWNKEGYSYDDFDENFVMLARKK